MIFQWIYKVFLSVQIINHMILPPIRSLCEEPGPGGALQWSHHTIIGGLTMNERTITANLLRRYVLHLREEAGGQHH